MTSQEKEMIAPHQVLFEISQGFTQIMGTDVDKQINHTLERIGSFDRDDRSYVFLFDESGERMSNTHEWCAEGIESQIEQLTDIPSEVFTWWMQKLNNFECIQINDVNAMPKEACTEKDLLQQQDIQSVLVLPIIRESRLIGYIGFDSVRRKKNWSETSIALLQICADIIGNALLQKELLSELAKSENFYRTIFESTGTPSVILDNAGSIIAINRCCKETYRFANKDLMGKSFLEIVAPDYCDTLRDYHIGRRKKPVSVPNEYYADLLDAKNKRIRCKIYADIIPGTSKSIVSFVDLSEIYKANRSMRMLSEINRTVLHSTSEKEMMDAVCKIIVDIGGYCGAWTGYLERSGTESSDMVLISAFGHEQLESQIGRKFVISKRNVELEALEDTKTIAINNLVNETRPVLFQEETTKLGINSLVIIPLSFQEVPGRRLLAIYSSFDNIQNNQEIQLLENMISNIAFGVNALQIRSERDETIANLKINSDNLNLLMQQTVTAFRSVVQIRDPYTAEHQDKVARLSQAIAKQMDLSEEMCNEVYFAASIHDIGKINVPSDILNKPGKLSVYEFELIKEHCQAGYDIICNINFPWSIAQIILQHHERMDGSGYPKGLSGGEILLAARILCVADVFDAMSSHRPYRPAMGYEYALKELKANRGQLYDREVVDACLAVIDAGFHFDTKEDGTHWQERNALIHH